MININFIFKIFTYFLKFFFFPVSILSTYFFDFFNLDLFNQKKVVELTNQINELKELNSIQNKELKNNSSLLKQNVVQSYDIKNILIYSAGIITTCIIIFGIYSFFNNGDSAFGFITENSAQNAHRVVEDIKIQSQLSNGVNHDLSDNTLQVIGAVGTETISTLTGVAETISTNSNIQSTESVGLALETINSNLTNINNGLNLQIANVVNYIQANVAQKLNRIDITLVKSVEMLNAIVDGINNAAGSVPSNVIEAPIWGEGHILGSDPSVASTTVPVEVPVPSTSGFSLSPSDLEFE